MNRYVVLAASIIMQICLGGVYAWSTFAPSVCSSCGLTNAQSQLIFGVAVAMFAIGFVIGGRLQPKIGTRLLGSLGGIMLGLGYLLASRSDGSLVMLVLGIGFAGGLGIGLGYVGPITTSVKWFPEHKGLVMGLAIGAFGAGAVALSALGTVLLNQGMDVLKVFRIVGLIYGPVVIICAQLLSAPKNAEAVEVCEASTAMRDVVSGRFFWSLAIGMLCGTFAGLLVIGNIKPMGLSAGVSASYAASSVGVFAIGNALGRITWGYIADRIGRKSILISPVLLCLTVLAVLPASKSSLGFVLAAGLVGFGFGSCFIVYAAQVASVFGVDAVGSVYPFIFLFYGLSGIAGPMVGGWLYDQTGSYTSAIAVASSVAMLGAILTTVIGGKAPKPCATRTPEPGSA